MARQLQVRRSNKATVQVPDQLRHSGRRDLLHAPGLWRVAEDYRNEGAEHLTAMSFFSFFKRKKAAPVPPPQVLASTPVANSDATSQISWLTGTLLKLAAILNQPSNQTLKDLPAHAERVMVELFERRERDREKP